MDIFHNSSFIVSGAGLQREDKRDRAPARRPSFKLRDVLSSCRISRKQTSESDDDDQKKCSVQTPRSLESCSASVFCAPHKNISIHRAV